MQHSETLSGIHPKTREIYEQILLKRGFVPNVYAAFGDRPDLLSGFFGVTGAVGSGQLNDTEREIVLLTTSVTNRCRYCVAGHSYYAGMTGVDPGTVANLRDARPLTDPRLEVLRRFARALARGRGHEAQPEHDAMQTHGFTQAQVLDVIMAVALKTLSNMTATLLKLPLDPPFKPFEWEPDF